MLGADLEPGVPFPAHLVTSEGATEATLLPVSVATLRRATCMPWSELWSDAREVPLRTVVCLGDAALRLRP